MDTNGHTGPARFRLLIVAAATVLVLSAVTLVLGRTAARAPALLEARSSPPAAYVAANAFVAATVTFVVDGDTIHVRLPDGGEEKVRLIGIDAPEWTNEREPFGAEAAAHVGKLLPAGKAVWLERDAEARDRYGRLLAYVWLAKPELGTDARTTMLNAVLLEDGYARLMTVPPNVGHLDLLRTLQAEALAAGRGLWGLPIE